MCVCASYAWGKHSDWILFPSVTQKEVLMGSNLYERRKFSDTIAGRNSAEIGKITPRNNWLLQLGQVSSGLTLSAQVSRFNTDDERAWLKSESVS